MKNQNCFEKIVAILPHSVFCAQGLRYHMEIQDFIGKAHGGEKILTGSYLKLPTKVGSYDIFFVEPLYKICTGLRGVLQEKNHPKECSVFASFAFFGKYM